MSENGVIFQEKRGSIFLMANDYKCIYCDKSYDSIEKARACRDTHDIIFMPIERSDLSRLANFILTGDHKLLTESLTKVIFRYFRKG